MDTGKLLKVIEDIQTEESSNNLQPKFQRIFDIYDQNDAPSINSEKEAIKIAVINSRISEYPLSDFEVLKRLNLEKLFGPGSYQSLEEILSSQTHDVKPKLQEFLNERQTKLDLLNQLRQNLENAGLNSRKLTDEQYEIGFSLPEQYLDIERIEEVLEDFRLFLNALANAVGEQQPLKIKYVSNGTIQFFIDAGAKLAEHFDVVLDYSLKIYGSIKAFADIKKGYRNYSAKRKAQAEKITDEERKEQVDKLLDELIEKLKLTGVDDKNRVKGLFLKLLEHLENGVSAEVHTPAIEEPKEPAPDSSDDEKTNYTKAKKIYDKKHGIDTRNREIFILQQNNFYGMDTKFLYAGDEEGIQSDQK